MKKYILEAGIIFLFIIIGVGIVSDIDANSISNQEVNAFEEKVESNEEVNDGNSKSFDTYVRDNPRGPWLA